MVNLSLKIRAEIENIEITLQNLKIVRDREETSVIELAATGTFIHNFYSGIENILKQILKAHGVVVGQSSTWHKDILRLAVSNGILTDELSDYLYEYLTFRHFFVHSYGFMLEADYMEGLSASVEAVWFEFNNQIASFTAE